MLNLICEQLGIVIGEEWLGDNGKTYMINNFGALWETGNPNLSGEDIQSNWMLLLTGKLKPVWQPKEYDVYYMPDVHWKNEDDRWLEVIWRNDSIDQYRFQNNLVFRNKEGAIEAANEILELWRGKQDFERDIANLNITIHEHNNK